MRLLFFYSGKKPGVKRMVVFAVILVNCAAGCRQYPPDVQQALSQAGNNSNELKKVLNHYSSEPADSLKLKAAYFLIANMPGRYYYEGELINNYYEFIAQVGKSPAIIDSIRKVHGEFSLNRLKVKYDLQELKADFLIDNIDWAFKAWKQQPWGANINFKQFCEYILPYRNGNEVPDYNRAAFYKKYNKVFDSVRLTHGDALQACFAVNNKLKQEGWAFYIEGGFLPYFSAQKLLNQRKGNCRDMVAKTLFVMRALGIPVASEFTPNWGNRSGGHLWNVVIDKRGKAHPFMGTENNDSRELTGGAHYTLSKVYRNTFQQQTLPVYLSKSTDNDFPELFKSSLIKDVTGQTGVSVNVSIPLKNSATLSPGIAYLCVFDNVDWVPVDWGEVKGKHAVFKNIMKNVVYLPAYFSKGAIIPANCPIMITNENKVKYLLLDKTTSDIKLTRKYPVFMKTDYAGHMKGGTFQAANDSSFSTPVNVYTIPYPEIEMKWYRVPVKLTRSYKYFRYLSPDGGWANIAELQFYYRGKKVEGRPIGSAGSWANEAHATFTSAFDNDESTFFNYKSPANGWTGLQLPEVEQIDEIRFLPRNDDNGIVAGQQYQLVYWDNAWVPAGTQIATSDVLVFKNVPNNALCLLHNLTKGKEERPFTYVNGKQIWW